MEPEKDGAQTPQQAPPPQWMAIGEFSEREQKEINFSRLYAAEFAHGTEGHNAKLVIAKMAALLDEKVG